MGMGVWECLSARGRGRALAQSRDLRSSAAVRMGLQGWCRCRMSRPPLPGWRRARRRWGTAGAEDGPLLLCQRGDVGGCVMRGAVVGTGKSCCFEPGRGPFSLTMVILM